MITERNIPTGETPKRPPVFTTPDSPQILAGTPQERAIEDLAKTFFDEAGVTGLSNLDAAWASKAWLEQVAQEHFARSLSAEPEITTSANGTVSGLFETAEVGQGIRVLIDTKSGDPVTTYAEVQIVDLELLRGPKPEDGVKSTFRQGTMRYPILANAVIELIDGAWERVYGALPEGPRVNPSI